MKNVLAVLCLIFAAPAHAVLLEFNFGGEAEVGFTPSFVIPFSGSYRYRGTSDPPMANSADVERPDGGVARDYFVGTASYGESIPLFPPQEPFPELQAVDSVVLQFGQNAPTVSSPFAFFHGISSVAFNRYLYEAEIWLRDPLFGFLTLRVPFSPPQGVDFWDRAFVDSLGDPAALLAVAALEGGSGMAELGQLGIALDLTRVSVTDLDAAAVPAPGSLALVALALMLLGLGGRRLR